ncbi:GrpB family protein [Enterococcus rivorum]|uniref:GrpB family protein n=1 Tax=Enterococcus rivorum TaxID=762845 RepID=UPI000AA0922C|nr:GrpB family protein [Enterococcus rivorum]MBP2099917.1 GrpB-like predicted nucleotidyltransferase (UPF0157 family) [Enterococcus rivorum]
MSKININRKKEVFSIRKIEVIDYDVNWPKDYLKEEKRLKLFLKKELIQSFHIGSTSVPGLKAKPIIDILLVVQDLSELDAYSDEFEKLGYEVLGECGIENRRFFQKGGEKRTHHIHAFQYDNINEIERHILYRNYLRTHPEDCARYASIKNLMAEKYPHDIEKYCAGKNELVKEIERLSLKWHWLTIK